jgi:peroxiredoxin
VFCRQQVAELAENSQNFDDKNVNLAVIGSGDPRHFKEFKKITGYGGLLFSDPSLAAFSLLGFSKGLAGFMSISSVFKAASALKEGHRQGSVQGSTMQLGGAIVIDVSGAVCYFFSGRKAGDHPKINELLNAVDDLQPL